MDFKSVKYFLNLMLSLSLMVFVPSLCIVEENSISISRATYYGSPDCLGNPTGACGFGEYGRTINDGRVTGVSRLFKNGSGCGACYQVKCTIEAHCSDEGINIVVTDYGEGDHTDFILSTAAYARLARPNMAEILFSFGVVDVQFTRIPCKYTSNLLFKVHEHSNYPLYLAILPLYLPSAYDILAIELWQEDCKEWRPMRRAFGTVFDITSPPNGALTLRYQTSTYGDIKWSQLNGVIPDYWKPGYAYDTGIST